MVSTAEDRRLCADVGVAMRMIRSDVMNGRCDLPSWLTAHLDTCEGCGAEKVHMFKAFGQEIWRDGQSNGESGQGWHGCIVCSGGVI